MFRQSYQNCALLLLLAVLTLCSGCGVPNLFAYFLADRDPKKSVDKEHDLRAEVLLILPYSGPQIRLEHPGANLAISNFIIQQIAEHLRGRVSGVVSPVQVIRYQQTDLDWENRSVQEIGRQFGADKVLYIEIRRLTLLEERSANLYRGRVKAHLQVIDVGAGLTDAELYEGDVSVIFPQDNPLATSQISRAAMQQQVLHRFAVETVWKFHDHKEPMRGAGK